MGTLPESRGLLSSTEDFTVVQGTSLRVRGTSSEFEGLYRSSEDGPGVQTLSAIFLSLEGFPEFGT